VEQYESAYASQDVWVVARTDDVCTVLSDPRFSVGLPGSTAAGAPGDDITASSLLQDPPGHTRLRSMVAQAFGPRMISRLQPWIQRTALDLAEAMRDSRSPADLVTGLARPLTISVITEILGVPPEERDDFVALANTFLGLTSGTDAERGLAWQRLYDYLDDLATSRRNVAREDFLTELTRISDADGRTLTQTEVVMMSTTLLVGGAYVTTANAIAIGAEQILAMRALNEVTANEDSLATAVEEVLRFQSGRNGESMPRIAREDVPIGEVTIPAGSTVIAPLEAANRDPDNIADPEKFDPFRASIRHFAFGFGIHYCLGASLARAEIGSAFSALSGTFPDLELAAPPFSSPWQANLFGDDGPQRLEVAWIG
jgi:cytochrome P450